MTYQREVSRRTVKLAGRIAGGSLEFTAVSRAMTVPVQDLGRWHVIPNGVSLSAYDFRPSVADDAPFVFLGRIEEIKGPHLAIEIARRTGRRLVIAGNIPPEHQAWFDAVIAPHVDGEAVRFVGPVNDAQKNVLLGDAAAFLMPILWEEPFGIVMAEAMACGTPVLGLARGAVPEVVVDGETGYVTETVDALADAARLVDRLDRADSRARVERLYSEDAVVDAYLDVYRAMIARRRR